MNDLVHSPLGGFHLAASAGSLIFGSYILVASKGSVKHKVGGYLYTSTMLATNLSAFGLFGLFGTFGPFHYAAIVSVLTLIMGLLPAIFRRNKNWLYRHMYWMHYSVFGLYAAFVSEIATRISLPFSFFWSVATGTSIVMISGAVLIRYKLTKWVLEAQSNMRIANNASLTNTSQLNKPL